MNKSEKIIFKLDNPSRNVAMTNYQVKMLKIGNLRSIVKNITAISMEMAEANVVQYLFNQCYGQKKLNDVNISKNYSVKSEEEIKFKVSFDVKHDSLFEFFIEITKSNSVEEITDLLSSIKVA